MTKVIHIFLFHIVTTTTTAAVTTTTTTTTTTTSSTVTIAYWTFDNVVTDFYGVYNGQFMNGAGFSPNVTSQPYIAFGRALFLNYALNQLFLVSTPFLDLTFKSFTIETWIYSTVATTDRGIFSQCQCSTCANQCLFLLIRANRLYVGFTLNDLYGNASLSTNTWYHIAFVYNNQTQQQILYINGFQDSIISNAESYQGTNGSIQIGSTQVYGTTNYFNGYIDNLMVTTRAKAASEILRDASLLAYYSFDLPNPTADSGPNGWTGANVNGVTASGRVNNALRFISGTAYFQSYGYYPLPFGVTPTKPFSVALWINPSSLSTSTIIQLFNTPLSGFSCLSLLGIYSLSGIVAQITVLSSSSNQILLIGPFVTSNTWTHISITYGSTNGYSLYVNGTLFGTTGSYVISGSTTLGYLMIGYCTYCWNAYGNGNYYGSIDEAYIYNRELAQSDVTALANP